MRVADLTSRGRSGCSPDQLLIRTDRQTDRVEFFCCHVPDDGFGEHEARDAVEGQGSVIGLRAMMMRDGRRSARSPCRVNYVCERRAVVATCDSLRRE